MVTTTISSDNPAIDSITTTVDDVTGNLIERVVNYANGVVAVAQFDANGVIVSRTLTDVSNAAKWATKSVVYEDGKIAGETVTYDDGVVQTTSYEDGKRLATRFVDHDNAQSYQWLERDYDLETGKVLVTRTLTDSGIMRIQAGSQGVELESTGIDEVFHGGAGADIFKFAPETGHDTIARFAQGQDRLDLTAFGIFTAADLDGKVTVNGRVTTIQLAPDDSIKLIGIGPLTDTDIVSEGPMIPAAVSIPAEDFELESSAFVESQPAAQGGEVIRLGDGQAGAASLDLDGAGVTPGPNDISITFFDENDGESTIDVLINGQPVATVTLDRDGGADGAQAQNLRTVILTGVEIPAGATLSLVGMADAGELLRVDTVEFAPNPAGTTVVDLASSPADDIVELIGEGDAVVTTGSGDDVVIAGNGNNTVMTGSGDDRIVAGSGDDRIESGAGNDQITIGDGNDVADAGAGDDVIVAGAGGGDDIIDGGIGNDTVTYPSTTQGIVADLSLIDRSAEPAAGGGMIGDLLSANGYDPNRLGGKVTGPEVGTDVLFDIENVTGGSGDDDITGNFLDNVLAGAGGDDTIRGGAGDDILRGGDGNDTLEGGSGFNRYEGGAGDDVFEQPFQVELRDGGQAEYLTVTSGGIEVLLGVSGTGVGRVTGGADVGTDTLSRVDLIVGTNFDDVYVATADYDDVTGASAFNSFEGGLGNDDITGNGETRISYRNALDGVNVDLAAGTAASIAPNDGAQIGNDILRGGINQVRGSAHNDSLRGSDSTSGFESFRGEAGSDTIDGGGGARDRADYFTSPTGVSVDLTTGVAQDGFGSTDTLANIERVRGSNFDDTLLGDANGNRLQGLDGDDTFIGGGGNDDIRGDAGAGDRAIYSGNLAEYTATDNLDGSTITITHVSGSMADGVDIVSGVEIFEFLDQTVSLSTLLGGPLVNIVEGDDGANTLDGTAGNDRILGFGGNDFIRGLEGDDILDGGTGDDTLRGGPGDDTLIGPGSGDDGFNRVDYRDALAGIEAVLSGGVNSESSFVISRDGAVADSANVGTDTLINAEMLFGSSFDDVVTIDASFLNRFGNPFFAFEGGAGNDTFNATGFGRVTFRAALDGVTVDLAAGVAQSRFGDPVLEDRAGIGVDNFTGVSEVHATDFDDQLFGRDVNGRDQFRPRAGDDFVDGRGGASDQLRYAATDISVIVDLGEDNQTIAITTTSDGFGGTDTVIGIEDIRSGRGDDILFGDKNDNELRGGSGNDELDGRAGDDALRGEDGNDTLRGGEGSDLIQPGAGNDIIDGGLGGPNDYDIVAYHLDGPTDSIIYTGGTGAGGNGIAVGDAQVEKSDDGTSVGTDMLTNIDLVIGTSFADMFEGGDANEQFAGSNGADVIRGGGGDDFINPGAGNDIVDGGAGDYDILSYGFDQTITSGIAYVGGTGANGIVIGHGRITGDGSIGMDSIENFERIQDTLFDDTFTSGSAAEHFDLFHGGDDDIIFGDDIGFDAVIGFQAGAGSEDVITFNASTFATFNDVLAASSDDGISTTITLDADNSVYLEGVLKAQLHVDDFLLV